MQSAARAALVLVGVCALAACTRDASDQNIMVDNNIADADIQALPADESSATGSSELANGAVEDNAAETNSL